MCHFRTQNRLKKSNEPFCKSEQNYGDYFRKGNQGGFFDYTLIFVCDLKEFSAFDLADYVGGNAENVVYGVGCVQIGSDFEKCGSCRWGYKSLYLDGKIPSNTGPD